MYRWRVYRHSLGLEDCRDFIKLLRCFLFSYIENQVHICHPSFGSRLISLAFSLRKPRIEPALSVSCLRAEKRLIQRSFHSPIVSLRLTEYGMHLLYWRHVLAVLCYGRWLNLCITQWISAKFAWTPHLTVDLKLSNRCRSFINCLPIHCNRIRENILLKLIIWKTMLLSDGVYKRSNLHLLSCDHLNSFFLVDNMMLNSSCSLGSLLEMRCMLL